MSASTMELLSAAAKKLIAQGPLVIVLIGGLFFLNDLNKENKAANESVQKELVDYLKNDQKEMVKMQERMLNVHEKQTEQLQKLNESMQTLIYETKQARRP